ncbi:hypothetical protein [Prosthecobacter sp.]|uniref:hypothetical protein n=1 Tax=Prosthecobacter sp. TaxID=1965333 RepID=UPI002ABB98AE|nr:hypothetical protein [Prosthecobacter sp.]MDZ4405545.1 hypothetical protein [Prosthecobacter sp.]
MTLLRSIVVLFALLAQAWPAQAMLRETAVKKCGMSCCASLGETDMDACGCAGAPVPAEPAQVPPASGRELMQQVVWVVSHESKLSARPPRSLDDDGARSVVRDFAKQPQQVRLPVLFCSLLN